MVVIGTGKTMTLVEIIKNILVDPQVKVLVATPSNTAADILVKVRKKSSGGRGRGRGDELVGGVERGAERREDELVSGGGGGGKWRVERGEGRDGKGEGG
jgi:hypothetical protein